LAATSSLSLSAANAVLLAGVTGVTGNDVLVTALEDSLNADLSQLADNLDVTAQLDSTGGVIVTAELSTVDELDVTGDGLVTIGNGATLATGITSIDGEDTSSLSLSAANAVLLAGVTGVAGNDVLVTALELSLGADLSTLSSLLDVTAELSMVADVTLIADLSTVDTLAISGSYTVTANSSAALNDSGKITVASGSNLVLTPSQTSLPAIENTGTVDLTLAGDWAATSGTKNVATNTAFIVRADNAETVDLSLADVTGSLNGFTVYSTGTGSVIGSGAVDRLFNTSGNTTFTGGLGADTFTVSSNAMTITDLTTNDVLVVEATGSVIANSISAFVATANTTNAGSVTINSDSAGSTITLTNAGGTNGFTVNGNAGVDNITGSSKNDTITGGAGADSLNGGAGDDVFIIANASDYISNSETITGGLDTDAIWYTSSAGQTLTLESNVAVEEVRITNTSGQSTGTTAENINAINVSGSIALYGNDGDNQLVGNGSANVIYGNGGTDSITGGAGADNMYGGDGDDIFIIASAVDFANGEIINGDNGSDTIYFTSTTSSETLTLSDNVTVESVRISNSSGVATGTTALNIDATNVIGAINLYGNAGANVLTGNSSDNILSGNDGADTIIGGAGNDTITGGVGSDSLSGGDGNDTFVFTNLLDFSNGDSLVTGNAGIDNVQFNLTGNIIIADTAFTNIALIEALSFNTTGGLKLYFSTQGDLAFSNGVVITALNANAIEIVADSSNISITASGNAKDDTLNTGAGNDLLSGGTGADSINSGFGSDTVTGGAGVDTIYLGNDTDADTLVIGTVSTSGIDIVQYLDSNDYVKFSTVTGYTNYGDFDGNGSLITALNEIGQFIGVGEAVGFNLLNADTTYTSYIFINEGVNTYTATDDAVIKLAGTVDLDTLSAGNFINL
jgi:Ca2+-binding RTX toxin-like protein